MACLIQLGDRPMPVGGPRPSRRPPFVHPSVRLIRYTARGRARGPVEVENATLEPPFTAWTGVSQAIAADGASGGADSGAPSAPGTNLSADREREPRSRAERVERALLIGEVGDPGAEVGASVPERLVHGKVGHDGASK